MSAETSQNEAIPTNSLNTLVLRSLKRSRDMFINEFGTRSAEDFDSQRLKIMVKVHDEYESVRDMPPPPKPAAASTTPGSGTSSEAPKATQKKARGAVPSAQQVAAGITVAGPHPFPNAPGVTLSAGTAADQEGPSEGAVTKIINSLPDLKARREQESKTSTSVVQYIDRAGLPERYSGSTALARIGGGATPRSLVAPEWHAPWKLMRVVSGHLGWVRSLAVDPSNEWFASGSADRTIKIWDLASGTLKLTLTGHISAVRGLAISDRHPYLFSVGEDKQVKCWDLEQNKVIKTYHGHLSGVYSVAIHPTLDILVTGGRDSVARVWDIRTKSQIHCLSGHTNTVASILTQGVEPQIITGSHDTTIRLWDLAAGRTRAILTHHKKAVRGMALHSKEYSFVSGAPDNLKKWMCPDGKFLHNMSGHNALVNCVATNDDVVFSGADNGSFCFFDWKTGHKFQDAATVPQPGSLDSENGIYASTFDKTGMRLLTAEADKTIKVWKEDETATPESHPLKWKPTLDPKKF